MREVKLLNCSSVSRSRRRDLLTDEQFGSFSSRIDELEATVDRGDAAAVELAARVLRDEARFLEVFAAVEKHKNAAGLAAVNPL